MSIKKKVFRFCLKVNPNKVRIIFRYSSFDIDISINKEAIKKWIYLLIGISLKLLD
jgi:hypothetical protein